MSSSLNEKVDGEQNATENNLTSNNSSGSSSDGDNSSESNDNTNTTNNNNNSNKSEIINQIITPIIEQKDKEKDIIPEVEEPPKAELCKNHCGFYGNPKNRGLCSTCYNSEIKNEQKQQQPQQQQQQKSVQTTPEKPKKGTKRSIYEATYFDQFVDHSTNNNNNDKNTNTTTTVTNTTIDSSPASSSFSSSSLTPSKQNSSSTPSSSIASSAAVIISTGPASPSAALTTTPSHLSTSPSVSSPMSPSKESAKCAYESCGKKLGIMSESNRCRCGGTYCGKHMHNHECQFDYKSMAKSNIAKANPQIMANKIVKL